MAESEGSRRTVVLLWVAGTVLAAAVVFGGAQPAAACSCAVSRSAALAGADAVFTGVLEAGAEDGDHVFAVDEVFKGRVHERQWVVSDDPLGCGSTFNNGVGAYLVVADGPRSDDEGESSEGSVLHTHSCMGNTPLEVGLPDGLGPPSAPLAGTSPVPGDGDTPIWLIAGVAAAGLAVVAAGAFGLRGLARRRRDPAAG